MLTRAAYGIVLLASAGGFRCVSPRPLSDQTTVHVCAQLFSIFWWGLFAHGF